MLVPISTSFCWFKINECIEYATLNCSTHLPIQLDLCFNLFAVHVPRIYVVAFACPPASSSVKITNCSSDMRHLVFGINFLSTIKTFLFSKSLHSQSSIRCPGSSPGILSLGVWQSLAAVVLVSVAD